MKPFSIFCFFPIRTIPPIRTILIGLLLCGLDRAWPICCKLGPEMPSFRGLDRDAREPFFLSLSLFHSRDDVPTGGQLRNQEFENYQVYLDGRARLAKRLALEARIPYHYFHYAYAYDSLSSPFFRSPSGIPRNLRVDGEYSGFGDIEVLFEIGVKVPEPEHSGALAFLLGVRLPTLDKTGNGYTDNPETRLYPQSERVNYILGYRFRRDLDPLPVRIGFQNTLRFDSFPGTDFTTGMRMQVLLDVSIPSVPAAEGFGLKFYGTFINQDYDRTYGMSARYDDFFSEYGTTWYLLPDYTFNKRGKVSLRFGTSFPLYRGAPESMYPAADESRGINGNLSVQFHVDRQDRP